MAELRRKYKKRIRFIGGATVGQSRSIFLPMFQAIAWTMEHRQTRLGNLQKVIQFRDIYPRQSCLTQKPSHKMRRSWFGRADGIDESKNRGASETRKLQVSELLDFLTSFTKPSTFNSSIGEPLNKKHSVKQKGKSSIKCYGCGKFGLFERTYRTSAKLRLKNVKITSIFLSLVQTRRRQKWFIDIFSGIIDILSLMWHWYSGDSPNCSRAKHDSAVFR